MKISIERNNPLQTKEVRHTLLEAGCKYAGVDEKYVHFTTSQNNHDKVMWVLMLHTQN